MNLTELQAEVIVQTNRPDLVAMTLSAVQSATLRAHHSDYFPRDIDERGINFGSELYEHDFEVKTYIPRFRAIKYARHYDNAGSTPGKFFDVISPENVIDSYGYARTNVCYLGGIEIHFKAHCEFQHILFGSYISPDITVATWDSWIARDYPFVIVYDAAATIARNTGNSEKFSALQALYLGEQARLINGNVLAVGY